MPRGRRARPWTERVARRGGSPEIDLTVPGFGVSVGRESDRVRVASRTKDPGVHERRKLLLRRLAEDAAHFDLIDRLLTRTPERRLSWGALERAAANGAQGLAALRRQLDAKRLDFAVAKYVSALRIATKGKVQDQLEHFVAWSRAELGREPLMTDFTKPHAARFLDALRSRRKREEPRDEPVSAATRNRYRAALSGFARWAIEHELLAVHPIAFKAIRSLPEAEPEPPVVPPEVLVRYLAAVDDYGDERRALFLWTLVLTGADVYEVQELTPARVTWARGASPGRFKFRRNKTKTPWRSVPVSHAGYLARLRALFAAHGGGPGATPFAGITHDELWTLHRRARKLAGVPKLTVKGLRHVAGQMWRRAGADLQQVQEWLGHATLNQSRIYAAFGEDDTVDAPVAMKLAGLLGAAETAHDLVVARHRRERTGTAT